LFVYKRQDVNCHHENVCTVFSARELTDTLRHSSLCRHDVNGWYLAAIMSHEHSSSCPQRSGRSTHAWNM